MALYFFLNFFVCVKWLKINIGDLAELSGGRVNCRKERRSTRRSTNVKWQSLCRDEFELCVCSIWIFGVRRYRMYVCTVHGSTNRMA